MILNVFLNVFSFFNFTFGSARLRSQWIPRSRVHAAFESSRLRRFTFEAHVRQQHDAGSVPHLDSVIKDISIYIAIITFKCSASVAAQHTCSVSILGRYRQCWDSKTCFDQRQRGPEVQVNPEVRLAPTPA